MRSKARKQTQKSGHAPNLKYREIFGKNTTREAYYFSQTKKPRLSKAYEHCNTGINRVSVKNVFGQKIMN